MAPVGGCPGGIAQQLFDGSTPNIRASIIGLEADCFGVVLNRFVVLLELGVGNGSSYIMFGIPGPKPDGLRSDLQAKYIAPRNGAEMHIAKIWQELLQLDRVGSQDNFFDLGGHSLLLIQVRSRLEDVFARNISTTTLLEYPTISALAGYIGQEQPPTPAFEQGRTRAEARKALAKQQQERRQRRQTPKPLGAAGDD